MDYREKGNFLYPFPSPEKEGKTEKEKGFQKEKIKKKGTKNRKNFLQIFPVDPLPLFHKKEFEGEGKRKKSFPNSPPSPSFPFPKHEKKSENPLKNGRKETKRKKKEEKKKVLLLRNKKIDGR